MNAISKLRELQLEEIEALKSLIDFCEQNGLTYYMRGGSVLGAVKYKGMIPWDDDIDIILPREDYNRLIKIAPDNLGNAVFAHYSRNIKLNCYFARLYLDERKRTEKNLPKNNANGLVLVDILPIDGVPQDKLLRKLLELRVSILRLLASIHTLDHEDTVVKRNGFKKIIPEMLNKLRVHRMYEQTDIYNKLEKIYSNYMYSTAIDVGVLAGSKYNKEVFPKIWLGSGELREFENIQTRIPKQNDEYLKLLFGVDYMEREPDLSERVQKHFKGGI